MSTLLAACQQNSLKSLRLTISIKQKFKDRLIKCIFLKLKKSSAISSQKKPQINCGLDAFKKPALKKQT